MTSGLRIGGAALSKMVIFIAIVVLCAEARAQPSSCSEESRAVFLGAFSTHRALVRTVVRAAEQGRWHPDGAFRTGFFAQNARLLRDIRDLLRDRELSTSSVNRAFHRILTTKLPTGVSFSARLRRSHSLAFASALNAYQACLAMGQST